MMCSLAAGIGCGRLWNASTGSEGCGQYNLMQTMQAEIRI